MMMPMMTPAPQAVQAHSGHSPTTSGHYTRVYLLEWLVGTTIGTVPERLRHRDGPLHFSAH